MSNLSNIVTLMAYFSKFQLLKQLPHSPRCQYHNTHSFAWNLHQCSYHLGSPHYHPHKGRAHSSPIQSKKKSLVKTLGMDLKIKCEHDILALPSELIRNACCLHSQPPFSVGFSPMDDKLLLLCSLWRMEAHNQQAAIKDNYIVKLARI